MTRLLLVTVAGFLVGGCGERDAARAPELPRAEASPSARVTTVPATGEVRPDSPASSPGVARLQVPVTLHSSDESLDPCSQGAVRPGRGPAGDSADVRSGPGPQYPVVDRVAAGQVFYLCAVGDEWEGVVYPPQGTEEYSDCGPVSSPVPEPLVYRGPCKSGWVLGEKIELIAG